MENTKSWNTLGTVEKAWVASKASLNASALGKEGNSEKLINCGIDTENISTLGEYLAHRERTEKGITDNDKIEGLLEDSKLARTFVVPVILRNGQEIEVIVNQKGQDIACMYKDEESNKNTFTLTPRMMKQIDKTFNANNIQALERVVGEKVISDIRDEYIPENVEELGDKISQDELVPNDKKVLNKVNEKNGISPEEQAEIEENEKEIPGEIRDVIAQICEENGLDIKDLKEVMEVPPARLQDDLPRTGIKENDGNVICLRFKDASKLRGSVVMAQGDKIVKDETYDSYMNDYMDEHKNTSKVRTVEDEHDQIEYRDLDGNVTICEIFKEPRDLNCTDKERIQKIMEDFDESTKDLLNSDKPLEEKVQGFLKINSERLKIFNEYGIEVPTVQDEIEADIEISEEIQNDIEEKKESQEEAEIAKKEKAEEDIDDSYEEPTIYNTHGKR